MKKRLLTVNITYMVGEQKYTTSRLASLKFDPKKTPSDDAFCKRACEVTRKNFNATFPYLDVVGIDSHVAIEADFVESEECRDPLEDGYSSEISIDRIEQLVEETKPYTDRLVLNGWAPMETIEHFQARGHYVNTFEDPDNKDQYTVIKWGRIHTEPSVYIGGCEKCSS